MNRKLVHKAALRRDEIDALQLILSRNLAFDVLGRLRFNLTQAVGHFAAKVLIDLDDLELRLRDLAARLGLRRRKPAALTVQIGAFALQRHHALDRHEALLPEFAYPFKFPFDQGDATHLRVFLGDQAAYLFLVLKDTLAQLRLLPVSRFAAKPEQLTLPRQQLRDVAVACAHRRRRRK